MLRLNRLILNSASTRSSTLLSRQLGSHEPPSLPLLPSHHLAHRTSTRFLDIYQLGNKEAFEKERARLADEMNRGYFADMSEFKQHGGKVMAWLPFSLNCSIVLFVQIAMANKIIIPAMAAMKFPALEVNYSDGRSLKLPISSHGNEAGTSKLDIPKASLLCLSFRASSQAMIDSWSKPFFDAFSDSKNVQLYEVSFVDSWFLSLNPIKRLLLRIMKKSKPDGKSVLQRQIVYSFGDHYYFRKELKILNLLTGYMFLVDKFGRIRWQGFGLAAEEELASLLSCTTLLLEEK
ncbi:hypothetical protein CK203_004770 [Vitis vinifera]|uniref:Mitochondrial ATPase complex subunit ATP10 n=1 Tax=Vitis vinifera TaxID=29760 RepID=A0A438KGA6_VITVI|nr:hypothetical protein CK203_004770 [Vitis vinifera]